jgi:hypothetical protein
MTHYERRLSKAGNNLVKGIECNLAFLSICCFEDRFGKMFCSYGL